MLDPRWTRFVDSPEDLTLILDILDDEDYIVGVCDACDMLHGAVVVEDALEILEETGLRSFVIAFEGFGALSDLDRDGYVRKLEHDMAEATNPWAYDAPRAVLRCIVVAGRVQDEIRTAAAKDVGHWSTWGDA